MEKTAPTLCPQDLKENSFNKFRINVLINFQGILLGEVEPELRGVTVSYSEKNILAKFYYDCEITEDIEENVSMLETLMMASFEECTIKFEVESIKYPQKMPSLWEWVYLRKEKTCE